MCAECAGVVEQPASALPLNHAKLSTGGAASLEHVRVTEPPSDTSPAGKSVMEVERGASVERKDL